MQRAGRARLTPALGLRANAAQFGLLVGVNGLVGAMVGQERALLSLLADETFGIRAYSSALVFIVAFGATKAVANLVAGIASDAVGRKPVLLVGWALALPVPFLLMWGPSWGWVVAANVLLGANQGLAWSATVVMKVDLAGPRRRGLAMGINEAAGYAAVAAAALATGAIAQRWGLRPAPFLLGVVVAALGLGLSAVAVRETAGHAAAEGAASIERPAVGARSAFVHTSFRDPTLSAVCQAGFVNNLNDAMAWGLVPLVLTRSGLDTGRIGIVAATYPAVWALVQLVAGPLSDVVGRKWLIAAGMWLQATAIAAMAVVEGFGQWVAAAAVLGVGTGMVYPSMIAAVGDVAHPSWRASAVGTYRLWRDAGIAVGALAVGAIADSWSPTTAISSVAALTAASGLVVALRMRETLLPAALPETVSLAGMRG